MGHIHWKEADPELEFVVVLLARDVLFQKLFLDIEPDTVVLGIKVVEPKVVFLVNLKHACMHK
jgi:hypothetical protein